MPNKAPAFLAEVSGTDIPLSQDKLTELRNEVVRAKKLALQIADLEEQLADANKELNELQQKTLPDLFMEIGIDEIAVPAEGNMPAFKATCSPFYAAGIPVKWDAVKRQEAFAYLTELGAGDLIKTELNIKFGRDHRNEAVELAKELHDKGLTPDMKEAVHSATLTAWLREMVEINGFTPDLEKIGGTVGRVVKIKEKR
jgi:hypothetical protein